MKSFSFGRPWKFAVIALLLLIVGLKIVFRSPTPPPVMVLPPTTPVASQPGFWLDRWIPRTWGWLWRVRYVAVGKPRPITLGTSIVGLANAHNEQFENVLGTTPTFTNPSALRIWIADNEKLDSLRTLFEKEERITASPRATTAEGIGTSQSVTSSLIIAGKPVETGLRIEYMPRIHKNAADLTALIEMTEALTNNVSGNVTLHTNLNIITRLQLSPGKGAFILQDGEASGRKRYGILVSATVGK